MTKTFGWAIKQLQNGDKVRRSGWNGKGMWLGIQTPAVSGKREDGIEWHPYIYMSDVNGVLFPWNPNNLDIFATDWEFAA